MEFNKINFTKFVNELTELSKKLNELDREVMIRCQHNIEPEKDYGCICLDIDEYEFDTLVDDDWNALSQYNAFGTLVTNHNHIKWLTSSKDKKVTNLDKYKAESLEELAQNLIDYIRYFNNFMIDISIVNNHIWIDFFVDSTPFYKQFNTVPDKLYANVNDYKNKIGNAIVPTIEDFFNAKYDCGVDNIIDDIEYHVSVVVDINKPTDLDDNWSDDEE